MTPAAGGWRDPCCVGGADGRDADLSGARAEPRAAEPVGGGCGAVRKSQAEVGRTSRSREPGYLDDDWIACALRSLSPEV